MNKRIIPIKNYFIISLIFIVLIALTYYLISWYEATKGFKNDDISQFLPTVKIEEIDNFLVDNPNIVIYIADSYDKNNDNFELKFKEIIIDYAIKKEIIYIDNHKNKNYSKLEDFLSNDLKSRNVGILNNNNLLIVKDGEIIDILYKNNKKINIDDVTNILLKHEVIQ